MGAPVYPNTRVSYFYQLTQDRIGGWSESFYNDAVPGVILENRLNKLRSALQGVRGVQTVCSFVRISQPAVKRQAQVIAYPDVAAPVGNAKDSDFVDTALLVKLTTTRGAVVHHWLRGIPDRSVQQGGRWVPVAADGAAFESLASILGSGNTEGWQCFVSDPTFQPKRLLDFGGSFAPGTGTIILPAHGFASGDKVRVSRVGGGVGANGLWTITVVDASTFTLNQYTVPSPVWAWNGKGYVRKISMIADYINGVFPLRASEHRTGRPFGLLSGRRRPRRS